MRILLVAAALVGLVGCGAGPLEPTGAVVPAAVAAQDPRVAVLLAELETIKTPLPWNGKMMSEWAAGVRIVIRPLDPLYGAVWTGSEVVLNANLTGYDLRGQAALIAHEVRHADGVGHDCGPHQDHRATAWSAYAVHVWTLQQFGEAEQAKGNEGGFCD